MLSVQDKNIRAYDQFRRRLRYYLKQKHGRTATLAAALGVNRQSAWRWFVQEHGKQPAWAAVVANIWLAGRMPRCQQQTLDVLLGGDDDPGP